jgi:hypothetical protein
MFTVLSNTRNANLYLITALAIVLVVLLTFAVVPAIATPKPASVPITDSQNAYVEFLRGEKVMYGNPAWSSEALAAYHLGEKAIYTKSIDVGDALSAWRAGEKVIVRSDAVESALWTYRMGEKGLK